ncbi:MULE transposase domain [Dillenia turbinata]|uniref:MULE transposase domain n=1 Tax=Dillenia turbinata TaxID=194707 RepID=A0AAN8ZIW6_9MAGN
MKTLFCYCHVGGELIVNSEGSVSYKGGTVDGLVIDQDTTYDSFITAVCEQLNITPTGRIFQYSVKYDKSRLMPLKNQNAINNLLNFNDDVGHVYVTEAKEVANVAVASARCSSQNESTADQCVQAEHAVETVDQCVEAEHESETMFLTDGSACSPRLALSSKEWDEEIMGAGQKFDSAEAFRMALCKYAFAKRFNYKFVRNHHTQMSVVCAVDGCCWKLTAYSSGKGSSSLTIRKFVDSHNHPKQDESNFKSTMKPKFILELVGEKITSSPNYLPREICKDIESAFDVKLSYQQSWRTKEKARLAIFGKTEDSYKLVPHLCQRLINVMPGTVATWTAVDSRFRQLFVSYNCSIRGFLHACRPLLFVDDFELSKPSRGVLLSVSALDANDNAFPLAYGVINSDDNPDCVWFFERLKSIIGDCDVLIITDRKQSLLSGLNQVFGSENNSYCFRSIKADFSKFFRQFHLGTNGDNTALTLLDDIAFARLDETYDKALKTMRKFNKDMYDWVLANNPELWANSLIKKKRWDKMNSDLTEPFNSWVLKNCQVPVLEFIKAHGDVLAELLVSRQRDVASWKSPVGDKIEQKINENLRKSEGLLATQLSEFVYEFTFQSSTGFVDLSSRACTCLEWQMTGIPCQHACRVLEGANLDVYSYVEKCYYKETQEAIYAELMSILPVDDMALGEVPDSECGAPFDLLPPAPITKRTGRPKLKPVSPHVTGKRPLCCSLCNESGHNRATCKKRKNT